MASLSSEAQTSKGRLSFREKRLKLEMKKASQKEIGIAKGEEIKKSTQKGFLKIQSIIRGYLIRRHYLGVLKFRVNAQKTWSVEETFNQYCELERMATFERARNKRSQLHAKLKLAFTKSSKMSMAALKSEVPQLAKHTSLVVKLHNLSSKAKEHMTISKLPSLDSSSRLRSKLSSDLGILNESEPVPAPATPHTFSLDTVLAAVGHAGKCNIK
jgi:hypothetical protein